MFLAGPSNGAKKKKREETRGVGEISSPKTDASQNAKDKFEKKTKIPDQPKIKQIKNNGIKVKQFGQAGTPVKRGRKPNNQIVLKKKPANAFLIKEHFKKGFQSDARQLAKPKDSLVNYQLIVTDKKWITFINNVYDYNDETQKVIIKVSFKYINAIFNLCNSF